MTTCHTHTHCVDDALHTAEKLCADKALRFTDLRRRVLEMIWENHEPAKAYDLLDKLKAEDASAKPPTIYRTLDFLLENGLVHKLSSLNAYVGCSHPLKSHECYFLICSACGDITECCDAGIAKVILGSAEKKHFQLQHVMLEVAGLCAECRKQ